MKYFYKFNRVYFTPMNSIELSRKIELCRRFVRYAFDKLKEENDPEKNFDCVLEQRFEGDIYDCITEYFCDVIYDANEFSFEDYCNQHGGAFEDCVEFLQDFVDTHTDFEFLRLCIDDLNDNENNVSYVPDE